MYLIKPHGNLGYSRIEASNMLNSKLEEYEAEGYRSVTELEFTLAKLVSVHNTRQVIRIVKELADEIGEES